MTSTLETPTFAEGGPAIILVEPQMGENIGTVARAMANFGLRDLRLVNPRDGWPNERAVATSSGATWILDEARLFPTLNAAIADLSLVYATTGRVHGQAKPVVGPAEAAERMVASEANSVRAGVVFGRERNGLETHEVGLADAILTLPVNPRFASLNLAQAVLIVAYEWSRHKNGALLPFAMPEAEPAAKGQIQAFFDMLETELDRVEFFRPLEKKPSMMLNLRNIVLRMEPSRHDIKTLHGVIGALAEGRKGSAAGGLLNDEGAQMLRSMLVDHAGGQVPGERAPVRGLARLLRRNPTDAERLLWARMMKDRRFAGKGFRRAVPVGPHVTDILAQAQRLVVDIVPEGENDNAIAARQAKHDWLRDRDYRVIVIRAAAIEGDVEAALALIAQECG